MPKPNPGIVQTDSYTAAYSLSTCTQKPIKNPFSRLLLGRKKNPKNILRSVAGLRVRNPHLAFVTKLRSVILNLGRFCPQEHLATSGGISGYPNLEKEEVWWAPRGQKLGLLLTSCNAQDSSPQERSIQPKSQGCGGWEALPSVKWHSLCPMAATLQSC